MLTAELTDNAGWELLIALCDDAGEDDIGDRFRLALAEEEQHLLTVRSWVVALATANTASVAT